MFDFCQYTIIVLQKHVFICIMKYTLQTHLAKLSPTFKGIFPLDKVKLWSGTTKTRTIYSTDWIWQPQKFDLTGHNKHNHTQRSSKVFCFIFLTNFSTNTQIVSKDCQILARENRKLPCRNNPWTIYVKDYGNLREHVSNKVKQCHWQQTRTSPGIRN